MPEETVLVASAKVKDGMSQRTGKPYKRLVMQDGNGEFYSTFEDGLFEPAEKAVGKKAIIEYEVDGNFKNLIALRAVEEEKTPQLGTGDYVTGQKPAIEQRRMCALNAATNATAMTSDLLKFQTGQEVTPELYRAAWDAMHYHAFMANLRACQIMDAEDIPFDPESET